MVKSLYSAMCVAMVIGLTAAPAAAQDLSQDSGGVPIADVTGPGQAVAQPASQCPQTVGCQYAEENTQSGYRLQSVQVCGANCASQYWVTAISSGQQLIEIDPVRGGAVLAISNSGNSTGYPQVRVVMALYGPTDPACCPSGFSDTTYTWNPASGTLTPAQPVVTPANQFPGYDATRHELTAEGWSVGQV